MCESRYDHRGIEKKINFNKSIFPKFENKINHLILEEKFPTKNIPWQNQAFQREYLFNGLKKADENDLIMFSDPDEIPNPKKLKNIKMKKKYAIFLQNMYTYKFNIFNQYESLWEGTRICKKKDLKSIDWLRQKVLAKNKLFLENTSKNRLFYVLGCKNPIKSLANGLLFLHHTYFNFIIIINFLDLITQ